MGGVESNLASLTLKMERSSLQQLQLPRQSWVSRAFFIRLLPAFAPLRLCAFGSRQQSDTASQPTSGMGRLLRRSDSLVLDTCFQNVIFPFHQHAATRQQHCAAEQHLACLLISRQISSLSLHPTLTSLHPNVSRRTKGVVRICGSPPLFASLVSCCCFATTKTPTSICARSLRTQFPKRFVVPRPESW